MISAVYFYLLYWYSEELGLFVILRLIINYVILYIILVLFYVLYSRFNLKPL